MVSANAVAPALRPQVARTWMLAESLTLGAASTVHAGLLVPGHIHPQARTAEAVIATVLVLAAEAVIATVLVLAAGWTLLRPAHTRRAAILGQGFALAGTLVGLLTIVLGIGPRTVPDVVYHALLIATLVAGLAVAVRCRPV